MENKADVPKVSFLSFLGLTRKSKYIIESIDKNSSLSVIPVLAFCHFHAFFFLSLPCLTRQSIRMDYPVKPDNDKIVRLSGQAR